MTWFNCDTLERKRASNCFIFFAIVSLVVVQIKLIQISPQFATAADLKIYREAGQLVANGVDPYDFRAKEELRNQLRLDDYGLALKDNLDVYNYYVSGNLPASTLLYGLIELLSGGSTLGWRASLAAGNLGMLLAAIFFLRRNEIPLDRLGNQLALSLSTIWYPSLLYWGTILAEDKQFQIALMIALAALLTEAKSHPRANAALIGFVGTLSLLFKAFGLFLAPVAIQYFLHRPKREFILASIAGAATTALFVFHFDLTFFDLMLGRLRSSSAASIPDHGSLWTLFPAGVTYVRPLLSLLLVGLAYRAYRQGRIDLLNFCAATSVVFACIWLRDGSMDRMNMAMIFAITCLATQSTRAWLMLVLINSILQFPIYNALSWQKQYQWGINGETLDAVATLAFVISYFSTLLWRRAALPVTSTI